MDKIAQACNNLTPSQNGQALYALLKEMSDKLDAVSGGASAGDVAQLRTDLTALKTSAAGDLEKLRASHAAMAAKLNADDGVTGTDYASVASLDTKV